MIGSLTVELHLPEARSLKDKRQVVKSLIDTIRHRFNVSIAELDHQDLHQRATIGVVCLANEKAHVERVLNAAREIMDSRPDAVPASVTLEMF